MTVLCRVTAQTSCEAVKVKLISILGYIGKMAARKDNTLEILKVRFLYLTTITRAKLKGSYQVNLSSEGKSEFFFSQVFKTHFQKLKKLAESP